MILSTGSEPIILSTGSEAIMFCLLFLDATGFAGVGPIVLCLLFLDPAGFAASDPAIFYTGLFQVGFTLAPGYVHSVHQPHVQTK